MKTVHGSHHRGRVTEQDYKRNQKKRQSEIYLYDLPKDEYVVTIDGQYRCTICPHLPPFLNGRDLASHIKGAKHQVRKMNKLEASKESEPIPVASIAMPSLLYRTKEITKRVIASNHEQPVVSTRPAPKPFVFVPPALSPSGEPLWREKMLQEKEDEAMYQKGYRKNEQGEWYRDETVEFDSDESPFRVCYKYQKNLYYYRNFHHQMYLSEVQHGMLDRYYAETENIHLTYSFDPWNNTIWMV